jgi:hypothetical protein
MISICDSTRTAAVNEDGVPKAGVCGLVSIVIPCYRGEHYLREAIESCLRQTYTSFEVIVVDDASPDSCFEIATSIAQADSRLRVIRRLHNGGVSRAFNEGFAAANGEFLTRLAQDDVLEPFAVAQMVQRFRCAPSGTGLVYCDQAVIDESGRRFSANPAPPPENALIYGNRIGLCVMWTRAVWDTIGGFDPEFDASEDYEYWLRATSQFGLVKADGPPALGVRVHPTMGSNVYAEKQIANLFKAITSAHGERWRLSRNCLQRQVAFARAHLTEANSLVDRQLYFMALLSVALSFCEWPLPFPEGARRSDRPWERLRMVASLSRRLARPRLMSLHFLVAMIGINFFGSGSC